MEYWVYQVGFHGRYSRRGFLLPTQYYRTRSTKNWFTNHPASRRRTSDPGQRRQPDAQSCRYRRYRAHFSGHRPHFRGNERCRSRNCGKILHEPQFLCQRPGRFLRFLADIMEDTADEGFYYRTNTTAPEAQRIGLQIIRQAVGEQVILDKDGSPMLNPVGIVDTDRIEHRAAVFVQD